MQKLSMHSRPKFHISDLLVNECTSLNFALQQKFEFLKPVYEEDLNKF